MQLKNVNEIIKYSIQIFLFLKLGSTWMPIQNSIFYLGSGWISRPISPVGGSLISVDVPELGMVDL